jgi:hypothetical protein
MTVLEVEFEKRSSKKGKQKPPTSLLIECSNAQHQLIEYREGKGEGK